MGREAASFFGIQLEHAVRENLDSTHFAARSLRHIGLRSEGADVFADRLDESAERSGSLRPPRPL